MGFRITNAQVCTLEQLDEAFLIILTGVRVQLTDNKPRLRKRERPPDKLRTVQPESSFLTDHVEYGNNSVQHSTPEMAVAELRIRVIQDYRVENSFEIKQVAVHFTHTIICFQRLTNCVFSDFHLFRSIRSHSSAASGLSCTIPPF